ncbi:MAG: B12-binding domain-containing radical SAM protein [Omnitrophica WOR_2 bacterium GWA2_45_18]|nr:MAG: B12-binding domain-containing radical SAM protein [Omnitrophica WOR_2 bacterium GWA2_45_18]
MDIVFIKANNQKKIYQDLSKDFTGIEPPLWLALTAAYIREYGFSVAVIDAEAENLDTQETVDRIKEFNPRLASVVVSGTNPSASTLNMPGAGEVLREMKKKCPGIPTVISGLHPSALPERTVKEETADFVMEGEGLSTHLELLQALKSGKTLDEEFALDGLWYKRDGRIISHPRAVNVNDLGILPMPAWDLLPMEQYRAHNWHCFGHVDERQPYAVIYTSLGCPFNCSFCCINVTFGGSGIRYRPPVKVVEEIDFLVKNYGVKNIKVLDELFAMKQTHVEELCDRLIARGYDLNFWVYGRIDTVKESMLAKMKKAGINWIAYGIEAGSKRVRDGVSKGRFDQEQIRKVVKMTQAAGIYVVGNFIFGLPEDDLQTMQETLDLAKGLNCEYANFYCAMAYPGSKLYDDALAQGIALPRTWTGYAQFSEETFPLATKHISGADVLRFRDKAFDEYYGSPVYLNMIEEKFGVRTVEHIKEMCSVKLKRKY